MTSVARPDRGLLVGVDVGGSKIAVLVTDAALSVRGRYTQPSDVGAPDRAADVIASAVRAALADAGSGVEAVAAVGGGAPGRGGPRPGTVPQAGHPGGGAPPPGPALAPA